MFVAERLDNRVQVFDRDGTFRHKWGVPGTEMGNSTSPGGITAEGNDVYVTDVANNRVQVFDRQRGVPAQVGGPGAGDGEFNAPAAVDVKGQEVFVVDGLDNRPRVSLRNPHRGFSPTPLMPSIA